MANELFDEETGLPLCTQCGSPMVHDGANYRYSCLNCGDRIQFQSIQSIPPPTCVRCGTSTVNGFCATCQITVS